MGRASRERRREEKKQRAQALSSSVNEGLELGTKCYNSVYLGYGLFGRAETALGFGASHSMLGATSLTATPAS